MLAIGVNAFYAHVMICGVNFILAVGDMVPQLDPIACEEGVTVKDDGTERGGIHVKSKGRLIQCLSLIPI